MAFHWTERGDAPGKILDTAELSTHKLKTDSKDYKYEADVARLSLITRTYKRLEKEIKKGRTADPNDTKLLKDTLTEMRNRIHTLNNILQLIDAITKEKNEEKRHAIKIKITGLVLEELHYNSPKNATILLNNFRQIWPKIMQEITYLDSPLQ